MSTVSGRWLESDTNARVASQTYRLLVPHAKSRTFGAVKCQVTVGDCVANAAAPSSGLLIVSTDPVRRACASFARADGLNIESAFSSVPVAPTTQPRGTVTCTSKSAGSI